MSLCQRSDQARCDSARSPAKPVASALADLLSAVCCGLSESCDVAMPTALVNSYVLPVWTAKSTPSDASRCPWAAVVASALAANPGCRGGGFGATAWPAKPSCGASAPAPPVPCVRPASVTSRCPGTELEDTGTRSVEAPLPSTSVTRADPLHAGVNRRRTVPTLGC